MKLLGTFTSELSKLGVNVDKVLLKRLYDNLDPRIRKNAEIILLPVATAQGVIYGMNNKTGMPVLFNFSRASSATYFDRDMDIRLAGSDMPRIDYGNYSDSVKLLMEKESTNLLIDSTFELGLNTIQLGSTVSNANWLNFITKKANIPQPADSSGNYFYKATQVTQGITYCSSMIVSCEVFPGFSANNSDSEGRMVTVGIQQESGSVNIDFVKDTYYRVSGTRVSTVNHANRGTGFLKFSSHSARGIQAAAYQSEIGNTATSYIPTADTQSTRATDLLRLSLDKFSKITIDTVNNGTLTYEYQIGDIDIHNLIPSHDAILFLSVEYYEETSVIKYLKNIYNLGLDPRPDEYIAAYNSLSGSDKANAEIIFLPFHVSEGRVYAMDNMDGSMVEMNFQRSSSATIFDNNDIVQVDPNIPRIDYGNYSDDRKLLIEKDTTNFLTNSDFRIANSDRNHWVVASYVTTSFGADKAVYTIINPTSSARIQRTYRLDSGNHCVSLYANTKEHAVSFASFVNAVLGNQISPRVNKYRIHWCNFNVTNGTIDTIIRPYLRIETGWVNGEELFVKYIQIENNSNPGSFIPTTNSAMTRSADLLQVNLNELSTITIDTVMNGTIESTNQSSTVDIHTLIPSNDGIKSIIIKKQ